MQSKHDVVDHGEEFVAACLRSTVRLQTVDPSRRHFLGDNGGEDQAMVCNMADGFREGMKNAPMACRGDGATA
jgi:hypothetical protein